MTVLIITAFSYGLIHFGYLIFFQKKKNRLKMAEKLLEVMDELRGNPQKIYNVEGDLVENSYKFFTALLKDLGLMHRRWGISYQEILLELRGYLLQDLDFERKFSKTLRDHQLTFLLIIFMQLVLMVSCRFFSGIALHFVNYLIIVTIQGLGFIIYRLGEYFLRIKYFSSFQLLIPYLYRMNLLLEVTAPLNKIQEVEEVFLSESSKIKVPYFVKTIFRLQGLIERLRKQGASVTVEWNQELKSCYKELFRLNDNFTHQLNALKIVVLSLSFLSAYFYFQLTFFMEVLKNPIGAGIFSR